MSTADFYDEAKVRSTYYPEIVDAFKEATGAAHVYIFHHQVRNAAKNTGTMHNMHTKVQGYSGGVHSDSSAVHAEQMFKDFAGKEENANYTQGRFIYINAWRNISETPILDNHLAVLDETSVVAPDDYIASDLHMQHGTV